MTTSDSGRDVLPLRVATKVWFLISLQTFGGPAGQIAVMERILVEEKRWIGHQRFLFALSYCTLLPGPEAQQLATYIGWLLNGVKGALVAGVLFVLPGVVALLVLSGIYVAYGDTAWLEAVFLGVGPAVIAIVVSAVARLASKALGHRSLVVLAIAAFLALSLFGTPFPLVIAVAAGIGWWLGRRGVVLAGRPDAADDGPPPLIADDALHAEPRSARRSAVILVVGLVLWAAPVAMAAVLLGRDSVFVDQGLFFSGAAVVTFGGAYAVLVLRRAAGGGGLRLAGAGGDGPRAGARGEHAGSADHGRAVRGLPRGLPCAR